MSLKHAKNMVNRTLGKLGYKITRAQPPAPRPETTRRPDPGPPFAIRRLADPEDRPIRDLLFYLRDTDIGHFTTHEAAGLTLSIHDDDLGRLTRVLDRYYSDDTVFVNAGGNRGGVQLVQRNGRRERRFVLSFLTKVDAVPFLIELQVVVWRRLDTYSPTDILEAGAPLVAMRRIRATTFAALTRCAAPADDFSAQLAPAPPVDVVYTWVDDTDPEWRAQRARHSPDDAAGNGRATLAERFDNRDELKYSLRSLY
ncbi:MAG: Stealth CR1 domain-containing protein [Rubellimicrobium sp.]|nr:Stealth CR1 domain-containing protein [Rubellimicrobium sp.]